jgi:predicted RNase H-like HicB family nuclease
MKSSKAQIEKVARRYLKIIEWSNADHCYVGSAPPLIGQCCHGQTEAEVLAQLQTIVGEWAKTLVANGKRYSAVAHRSAVRSRLHQPKERARRGASTKRPWSGLETWLAKEGRRSDRNLAAIISEDRGDGRATPEEGRRVLLNAEGGCVSVTKACGLLRKPRPVTKQALIAQIRKGAVIGYHKGGGHYAVPVWQFRREGGILKGLPVILHALRAKVPGYGQISPFTFFLQADPLTDGRSPLAALRDGETLKVLDAVKARIC